MSFSLSFFVLPSVMVFCVINLSLLNKLNQMFKEVILLFVILGNPLTNGHIVGDKAMVSELKKLCDHAYSCYHDTVIVCGKSVSEARTFIDLCDLYEFSCENNMVYRHVKEEEGVCPDPKHLG